MMATARDHNQASRSGSADTFTADEIEFVNRDSTFQRGDRA